MPAPEDFILNITNLCQRISDGPGLAMTKLNHGFWEVSIRFQNYIKQEQLEGDDAVNIAINRHPAKRWPAELYHEVNAILENQHLHPNLLSLCSAFGWKNGLELEGTPIEGLQQVESLIQDKHATNTSIYDGLFWKNLIVNHEFVQLIECLRECNVIIVGPEYIQRFAEFAGFRRAHFVEVDAARAAWSRQETQDSISDLIDQNSEPTVCLIESGGVTSSWLVAQLHNRYPDDFFFSLGQALNICNLKQLEGKNWFLVEREEICDCIEKINPTWNIERDDYLPENYFSSLPKNQKWDAFKQGRYMGLLDSFVEESVRSESVTKIDFIENKTIDYALLEKMLERSNRTNHWANSGPATLYLSSLIHQIFQLKSGRSVVITKSGTEALHLAVRLSEYIEERPLRWVVSAFGFISTNIGPLADAQVVDCDHQGMLSIAALEELDEDSWDGLVITNTFGLCQDVHELAEYCATRNKKIILDNAAGLFSNLRLQLPMAAEVISFHQTKPWGMAEGGCLILDSEYKELANSLISFGMDLSERSRHLASNGKLSDINSALIAQRLIDTPNWAHLYRMQARRIIKLARLVGFELLYPLPQPHLLPKGMVVAHLPLLHPNKEIPLAKLENNVITLKRYYRPLSSTAKNVSDIFSRIVNFPCHPGVVQLSDEVIVDLLRKLV